ncbi:MAG: group 1 truncated hemoglobin [Pirellulales bacterium]|nr:group 1 truncated hemoglobin [Pirellulales bacterium]
MPIDGTLYERLGGDAGIKKLIVKFYGRVLADPYLMPFFANVSVEKLIRMQREFFGAAFDGPITYSGLSLSHAHANRGINSEHFGMFAQHLLTTLEENGVSEEDIRDVIHRIAAYKNDITGEAY